MQQQEQQQQQQPLAAAPGLFNSLIAQNQVAQQAAQNKDVRIDVMGFSGLSLQLGRLCFAQGTGYINYINSHGAEDMNEAPVAVQQHFWKVYRKKITHLHTAALKNLPYFTFGGHSLFLKPLWNAWFVLQISIARGNQLSLTTDATNADWATDAMKSIATIIPGFHRQNSVSPAAPGSLEAEIIAMTSPEDKSTDADFIAKGASMITNLWLRLTTKHSRRKQNQILNKANKEKVETSGSDSDHGEESDDEESDDDLLQAGARRQRKQQKQKAAPVCILKIAGKRIEHFPDSEKVFSNIFFKCNCGSYLPVPSSKGETATCKYKSNQGQACNNIYDPKNITYPIQVYSLWTTTDKPEDPPAENLRQFNVCSHAGGVTCYNVFPQSNHMRMCCCVQRKYLKTTVIRIKPHTVANASQFNTVYHGVMTEKLSKFEKKQEQ